MGYTFVYSNFLYYICSMKTIGNLMVLTHDIHYGYEGGYKYNFTIESDNELTEDEVRTILEKHFNEGLDIDTRKYKRLDYMPTKDDFNCELVLIPLH